MNKTGYRAAIPALLLACAGAIAAEAPERSSVEIGTENKQMPQLRFGSTVIYVESAAKQVIDFYHRAFGLDIRYYDPKHDFGELETSTGVTVMVASYTAGELMLGDRFPRQRSVVELAFLTTDVHGAYARAVAAGAKSVSEPKQMAWGQTAAYVTSLEGTLIALLTPPPAPPEKAQDR